MQKIRACRVDRLRLEDRDGEALPVKVVVRRIEPQEVEQGRDDVDQGDTSVDVSGFHPRDADEEGKMYGLFVAGSSMQLVSVLLELLAVVRGHDDDRVVPKSATVLIAQVLEQELDVLVCVRGISQISGSVRFSRAVARVGVLEA